MPKSLVWILEHVLPNIVWFCTLLIPGSSAKIARQQAKNKAYIMKLVNNADNHLQIDTAKLSLLEYVDKANSAPSFEALWLVEGVGFRYALQLLEKEGELPKPSLWRAKNLPDSSMLMLHAGLGLGAARVALHGVKTKDTKTVTSAIQKFRHIVDTSAQQEYVQCSYESLGLVALTLHGKKMVLALNSALQTDSETRELMWHGVGRALYFYHLNFLPSRGVLFRAQNMAERLAPDGKALNNLVGGIVAAFTLVNMQNPEVMDRLLTEASFVNKYNSVFADRVLTAAILRTSCTPHDKTIVDFYKYKSRDNTKQWQTFVAKPIRDLARPIYVKLKKTRQLSSLFHYSNSSPALQYVKEAKQHD